MLLPQTRSAGISPLPSRIVPSPTSPTPRSATASVGRSTLSLQSSPLEIPTVVAGEAAFSKARNEQVCPSEMERVITRVSLSTKQDVVHAIEASVNAWPSWRDRPIESRVELLNRLGDRLEADRFELAALQTFEEGKPWREADGDVAEAVDFCRYYARQALIELTPRRQGDMWGEKNLLSYEGRGPTVVIAPWNFPLAILCGMTTAALVAGNPVLMKPGRAVERGRLRALHADDRGRLPRRHSALSARLRRRNRRLHGGASRGRADRFHGEQGGRALHHRARRSDTARAASSQTRRL